MLRSAHNVFKEPYWVIDFATDAKTINVSMIVCITFQVWVMFKDVDIGGKRGRENRRRTTRSVTSWYLLTETTACTCGRRTWLVDCRSRSLMSQRLSSMPTSCGRTTMGGA